MSSLKRVACISYFRPDRENRNGPNALLRQLIVHRPPHVRLTLFLAEPGAPAGLPDLDCIDEEVEVVRLQPRAAGPGTRAWPFWPLGARQLSHFEWPDLAAYDLVWAYPFWFAPLTRELGRPVLITGMDCATLLYARRLRAARGVRNAGRVLLGLLASLVFDAVYLRGMATHVVGRADAAWLRKLGCNAHFVPHPLLDYPAHALPDARDPRVLTLLMANAGHAVYGSALAAGWWRAVERYASRADKPVVVVLHKPSAPFVALTRYAATPRDRLTVRIVDWIDDYPGFLAGIDAQLFPLEVGAGTKTSVLTALQHGVHCIASPIAAENIQPNDMLHVVAVGDDVAGRIAQVAALIDGPRRAAELTVHDPAHAGAQFWQLAHRL